MNPRKLLLALALGLFFLPPAWANEEPLTLTTSVQLQEKNLTVIVYYPPGSEPWARAALATASRALPVLEERIGFPYPYYFPIAIHGSDFKETGGRDAQVRWLLNLTTMEWSRHILAVPGRTDDLELVHELAHYWNLYDDIWMMEGFAQYHAFITLRSLGDEELTGPYYQGVMSVLRDNPSLDRPLGEWKWSTSLEERFLYRKSFFFVRLLADEFGQDTLRRINARIYQTEGIIPSSQASFGVVDFNYFKAALEKETGRDLSQFFSGWVTEGSYRHSGENATLSLWLSDAGTPPREAGLLQRLLSLLKGILGTILDL